MPITEEHLDAGRWSWDYAPDTPPAVLDQIDIRPEPGLGGIAFATAFVTPGHIPLGAITDDDLLDLATWRGVIKGMGAGRRSHNGYGLAHLLGLERSGGTLRAPPDATTPSRTMSQHMDDTVLLGTASANGLTKGTIVATAGFDINLPTGATRREILDNLVLNHPTNYEWVVHPDGSVDVNAPTTLFDEGAVILTPGGGAEAAIDNLRADIELSEIDVDNWVSDVIADWDGSSFYGSAANTQPSTWRGLAGDLIEWWDLLSYSPKGTRVRGRETVGKLFTAFLKSQTQANNFAAREAARRNSYRVSITAEIDVHNPWRYLHVGDWPYVYHPRQRIIDRSTQVRLRGSMAFPMMPRLVSWTTPVRERYGKYIAAYTGAGTRYLIDVTRWVVPEDSTTSMELGTRRRFGLKAPRPGPIDRRRTRMRAALTIFADRWGSAHPAHRR